MHIIVGCEGYAMKIKLLFLMLAVLLVSATTVLAGLPATTVVHGKVIYPNATGVGSGWEVTVDCGSATQYPLTDVNSEYQAEFNASDCWVGDTATASVPGDEQSAEVTDAETVLGSLIVQINLQVPEFTALASGIAFTGAGAGFLLLRRRK